MKLSPQNVISNFLLLEKSVFNQLIKKFSASYGSRRFITVFTRTRWIQPTTSYHTSLISTLILFYLYLDFPSCLFPSGCPTKILNAFLPSLMRANWPVHLILLDFITLIMHRKPRISSSPPWKPHTLRIFDEKYELWSSSLCNLLHLPVVTSSLLGKRFT
jgi:hypothetical protein